MSLDEIVDKNLPSWKRWRAEHAEIFRKAELLEQFAEAKQLPEGFLVYTQFGTVTLDWDEWGYNHGEEVGKTSMARFRTMILATANRLGRPDSVSESESSWQEAPNLIAEWKVKLADGSDASARVHIFQPKGCKVDPRHPRVAPTHGTPAKLHPECQAVLKELEELEAAKS